MAPLNSIANRLTPSNPIEVTFGAQPPLSGSKIATLFAHKNVGASAADYSVHTVLAFGDPDAAKTEIEAIAGVGSEAAKMAVAFIKANSDVGGRAFAQFRMVFIPSTVASGFGSAGEALTAVKNLRSDFLVSPYDATDASSLTALKNFAALISGPDRDVNQQFGSTCIIATIVASATALALHADNQYIMIPYLQDTAGSPAQAAAVVAAASAGVVAQAQFPYLPLDAAQVGGLIKPTQDTDKIVQGPTDLSELALAAGLAPITWDAAGNLRFVRTILTRVTTDGTTPATAYLDWQDVQTLYDFREDCYLVVTSPNIRPGKASVQKAALIKDEILRVAFAYEKAEAFQNVKETAAQFVVEPSATSRGRIDFRIPVDVIPGLHVVAGNIVGTVFTV